MKVLREVGVRRMVRFAVASILQILLDACLFPPIRAWILRLFGAKIGKDTVILKIRLINADRLGPTGLTLGEGCFVGEDVLLDLAAPILMGNQVTLASRVTVLTHLNVGYDTHPLQAYFPAMTEEVRFSPGCFIGACSVVLPGSSIGEGAFVAAGSVVKGEVSPWTLVAGVPARAIRRVDERNHGQVEREEGPSRAAQAESHALE